MMTGLDHLAWIDNDTGSAMRAPSSQLTGFIIPVMNPHKRSRGSSKPGWSCWCSFRFFVIYGADAVQRSARSDSVRWPASLSGSGRRLVSHHRPPSSAAAEYGSTLEVAGTPAPGSALISSLGRWPSLDR
jgi:hypothetical protein